MRNFIYLTLLTLSFLGMSQELDWKENGNSVYLNAPHQAGIRTINVDEELVVNGTLNASEFLLNGAPVFPWKESNGNLTYAYPVGIGINPRSMLSVGGNVLAEKVVVDLNVPGPDYVFESDYQLMSLDSLKDYVQIYKHLPYVPSAQQMEKEGVNIMENQLGILRSLEELVLHQIAMQKELSIEKEIRKEVEFLNNNSK